MSIISSAYQPTFSYEIDPLLNISPLIDLYSNCATHVVDTDGLFQLPAHRSPIILTFKRRILNSSLSYQNSFAGVRYPRCLLTIAGLFMSWTYEFETLLEYIIPTSYESLLTPDTPTRNFARVYPQLIVIVSNKSIASIDTNLQFLRKATCTDHQALFFNLRLNQDLMSFPRIIGEIPRGKLFQDLEFNCSTLESCKNEIEARITIVGDFVRNSWHIYGSYGNSSASGGSPFLEPKSQQITLTGPCYQYFGRAFPRYSSAPTDIVEISRTPVVKFVTTAGVFTPKSSYRVYFSPFLPTVWLVISISAGITVVMIIGVYKTQGTVETGLYYLTMESATWVFASSIGQYKHSGTPLISRSSFRQVVWIIVPVIVGWLVLSTFLVNVYSAIFNSDATRSFYYLTNYTRFLELPLDVSTYILVNESYVRRFEAEFSARNCNVLRKNLFCPFHNNIPAACTIDSAFNNAALRMKSAGEVTSSATCPSGNLCKNRLKEDWIKLRKLYSGVQFTCANTESITRILLEAKKPLAFLISDHDFQRYWKLFVQVMQSHSEVQVANNFYSDEKFLSHPVAIQFMSGIHSALKCSALARMKVLSSSGIYDLWEKWHHIKFTDGGLRHAGKKLVQENKVDRLSFDNSGSWWLFPAQTMARSGGVSLIT